MRDSEPWGRFVCVWFRGVCVCTYELYVCSGSVADCYWQDGYVVLCGRFVVFVACLFVMVLLLLLLIIMPVI